MRERIAAAFLAFRSGWLRATLTDAARQLRRITAKREFRVSIQGDAPVTCVGSYGRRHLAALAAKGVRLSI